MEVAVIACTVAAILGVLFGLRCYRELHKWARMCQRARIAVAYKNKVKIDAPLVEWLLWCNQLQRDVGAGGRTIYQAGGTRVAIIRPAKASGRVRRAIHQAKVGRHTEAPPVRKGRWSARNDTAVNSRG